MTPTDGKRALAAFFVLASVTTLGCASAVDAPLGRKASRVEASDYPEAVLIDMVDESGATFGCSGALLSRRVVITAGHCVTDNFVSWTVTAPHATTASGLDTVNASTKALFDYEESKDGNVQKDLHDVGLLYLDDAFDLDSYPVLPPLAVKDGTKVATLGRTHKGIASRDQIYVSASFPVTDGSKTGFPFDYVSSSQIEHGDSGGPLEVVVGSCSWIVGVNSGNNDHQSQYARVDLVYDWIDAFLEAHGGRPAPCGDTTTETDERPSSGAGT